MSNRERLALVLSEKMNTERVQIAMDVMDSFDRYILNQNISEEGLYEMNSIIKVSGLISKVKTDKNIKAEYKGKLFFLERGLFHFKNILVDMQNREETESAWREMEFEQEKATESSNSGDSTMEYNEEVYDEKRIAQMLNDPEGFIRSLSKLSRTE